MFWVGEETFVEPGRGKWLRTHHQDLVRALTGPVLFSTITGIISISVRDHRSREGKQLVQSARWSVTELDFENPD